MTNEEIIGAVWDSFKKREAKTVHELTKMAAENILKESMLRKSLDNVTSIVVAFSNLEYKYSHFDLPDSRPFSKHEGMNQSRKDFRKSEDFNSTLGSKLLLGPTLSTTTPGHNNRLSVGNLNLFHGQSNNTYDQNRMKTPINVSNTNNGYLRDSTNKLEIGRNDYLRKSGNLPKLQYRTPRSDYPK